MICFRFSNRKYEVGDTIPLGTWREYVRKNKNEASNFYEDRIEEFRVEANNPNLVSRDNCVFAFKNLSSIEGYILGRADNGTNGYIYELEVVEDKFSEHNYEIYSHLKVYMDKNDLEALRAREMLMRLYWYHEDLDGYVSPDGGIIDTVEEYLISESPIVKKIVGTPIPYIQKEEYLYHVTSMDNVESVLRNGIMPYCVGGMSKTSDPKIICLTSEKHLSNIIDMYDSQRTVVLKIDTSKLSYPSFYQDYSHTMFNLLGSEYTVEQKMEIMFTGYGTIGYTSPILKEYFQVMS